MIFAPIKPGYPGSSTQPGVGYHDIPLDGYRGPTHRQGTAQRIDQFAPYLSGRGLDIGCSVGGITLGLAARGHRMVGVDHDPAAIAVARRIAAETGLDATFHVGDAIDIVSDLLDVEFVIWLSQWMWMVAQHGQERSERLLADIAAKTPTLVFETAQGRHDGMAGAHAPKDAAAVEALLSNHFPHVKDLGPGPGGWSHRNVFVASSSPVSVPPQPTS